MNEKIHISDAEVAIRSNLTDVADEIEILAYSLKRKHRSDDEQIVDRLFKCRKCIVNVELDMDHYSHRVVMHLD